MKSEINKYLVRVIIENKDLLDDPEGETIYKDLILKNQHKEIISVRTGKIIRIKINAKSCDEAEYITDKICIDLRLFNPIVSNCHIKCEGLIEE